MPDPVTLAVLGGAQLAIGLFNTIFNTASAAEEARRRQELADAEAALLESDAARLLHDAGLAVDDYRREGALVHGRQLLAFARSGVRLSGSPTVRLAETRERIEEGSRRISDRAQFQADRIRSQANLLRESGGLGVSPGAVAISHLPSLLQSGLSFAGELDALGATTATSGSGGGVAPVARTHYTRSIDIS